MKYEKFYEIKSRFSTPNRDAFFNKCSCALRRKRRVTAKSPALVLDNCGTLLSMRLLILWNFNVWTTILVFPVTIPIQQVIFNILFWRNTWDHVILQLFYHFSDFTIACFTKNLNCLIFDKLKMSVTFMFFE